MTNDETIKSIADMLQLQGDEDLALELEEACMRAKHELERIKGIAARRLDRIAQLQHDLAVVEDKLEDTRSELRDTRESAHIAIGERNARIADLELQASLNRIRELDELGREPRTHLELGL